LKPPEGDCRPRQKWRHVSSWFDPDVVNGRKLSSAYTFASLQGNIIPELAAKVAWLISSLIPGENIPIDVIPKLACFTAVVNVFVSGQ
jgi:hypothetical protein